MRQGIYRQLCPHFVLSAILILVPASFAGSADGAISAQIPGMDLMVRKIEWHDDCYRVLDDPSVVNRYSFETFHQYLEYCVEKRSRGKELPWLREVLARHERIGDNTADRSYWL